MEDLRQVKEVLDEINAAISSYDPVLKEHARDLLLARAFGTGTGTGTRPRRPTSAAAPSGDEG
ncbi:MAG TPA: hypothetical protein VE871_09850, partial [Longimicrobium sp.]|nr:hypothetical protein [Longimicrobium sp.]